MSDPRDPADVARRLKHTEGQIARGTAALMRNARSEKSLLSSEHSDDRAIGAEKREERHAKNDRAWKKMYGHGHHMEHHGEGKPHGDKA